MANLFSPLTIGGRGLPNRIALAPGPCGAASADGFASAGAIDYYEQRARGGAGLLLTEPMRVVAPSEPMRGAHLGLYADAFVPQLAQLVARAHAHGARVLFALDEPAPPGPPSAAELSALGEAFVLAAWRAHCAGADGIMLSAADGGLFHSQLSPLRSQRDDAYGRSIPGRQRLALEIVETARHWLGTRLIIGFRLLAEEFTPGGLTLQDTRVLAKRLTAAGVRLLDVTAHDAPPHVARFPGWLVPLANSVKRIVDVPVIVSDELDDPHLADSVIRDGSVDMVMLDKALRLDPGWPLKARERLAEEEEG